MEGYSREDAIMLPHGFRHLDSNGHVDDLEMFYRQEVTATSDEHPRSIIYRHRTSFFSFLNI